MDTILASENLKTVEEKQSTKVHSLTSELVRASIVLEKIGYEKHLN